MHCNGTKRTPNLSADLFGDWREEIIFSDTEDPSKLRIYTTTIPTQNRLYTLMHDPVYRLGIAWQNVGYNQPPHLVLHWRWNRRHSMAATVYASWAIQ